MAAGMPYSTILFFVMFNIAIYHIGISHHFLYIRDQTKLFDNQ